MGKNVFHWLLSSSLTADTLVDADTIITAHKIPDRGYDIIPQFKDPIRCTYWQVSSLMFQITLKK